MRTMIERIAQGASRLLVLALGLGLVTTVWADADYVNVNFYYLYNSSYAYTAVSMNDDQSDSNNASLEGYSSYAVAGKYWSDVNVGNSAAQSVKTYDSSAGSVSASDVTVTVSGTNGGYFSGAGFDHHILSGYIDDNESNQSPLVTFANIPFDYYRVVVYFASSDGATCKYGHVTINDTVDLFGDGSATDIGTNNNAGWGGCVAFVTENNAKVNNIQLGVNTLVSPVIANKADASLKVQGRALYTDSTTRTYRACIAAIQIVKADAPANCTYTASESGTYNLFGNDVSPSWSSAEPTSGSEAVTIDVTGDVTLTVNDSRVFGLLSITGSGTLTLVGSGQIVTPSVTIGSGVTLLKTAGQISSSASVSVPTSSTFEIAAACIWSGVISGDGGVKVSADAVTFGAANTFAGGLTVANGGLAQSNNANGYGTKRTVNNANDTDISNAIGIVVQDGGTLDISGGYGSGYTVSIVGSGVNSTEGAVRNTGDAIEYSTGATGGFPLLLLTGNATVDVSNSWGISDQYRALCLGGHTLTIKSASSTGQFNCQGINFCGGASRSASETGSIFVDSGKLYTSNGNALKGTVNLTVGENGGLGIGGGKLTVTSTTINGNATFSGGEITGSVMVNGPVSVTGAFVCSGAITKGSSATATITIADSAEFKWSCNYEWSGSNGGLFSGEGTLCLNATTTNYGPNLTAGSSFAGKIKFMTDGKNTISTGVGRGQNGVQFANRVSSLELACGASASDQTSFHLGACYVSSALEVSNLKGFGRIKGWSQINGAIYKMDTLQTEDTVFSGTFETYGSSPNWSSTELTVRGDGDVVHVLTLAKGATYPTQGALNIVNKAKVVFTSEGHWSAGMVNIDDGGYLEVTNSSSVASTLALNNGGTLKIANVSDAAQKVTAGTVIFPTAAGEEAVIDISDIPDLATDDTVDIITGSTPLGADISKLKLAGKPYSLKIKDVDATTLQVVNDGGLAWTAANGWSKNDLTKFDTATITVSTDSDTVTIPSNLALDTLTLAGAGTVTINGTGGAVATIKNLYVPAGVTLVLNSSVNIDGATITGDNTGIIKIPSGTTYRMENVNCAVTVVCAGSLTTSGTVTLTTAAWARFESTSELTVENGTTTINAEGSTGFQGKITVASRATLVNTNSNSLGSEAELDISGTLNLGSTYWAIGKDNTITLHDTAVITGSNTNNGALDYNRGDDEVANSSTIAVEDGTATISAKLRVRGSRNIVFDVAQNSTLNLTADTWDFSGSVNKKGQGVLSVSANNIWNGVTTVEAGQVISTALPKTGGSGGSVVISSGATFTMKNIEWTDNPGRFSGNGTLELYNDVANSSSGHLTHSVENITFAGTLKFTSLSDSVASYQSGHIISKTTFLADGITPQLELATPGDGNYNVVYLGTAYDAANTSFDVRDLIGSGKIVPFYNGTARNHYINVVQTKNTEFSGNIAGDSTRKEHLTVTGDNSAEVHTLTVSGVNSTYGALNISNYAKVVFTSTGSWANGTVTVGADGWLESANVGAVTMLTLTDGANIVFPTSSSTLTGITSLSFASGTTYIAFPNGAPDAETTIIDWTSVGAAPGGDFKLVGDLADTHVLTKGDTGLTIKTGVASVRTTSGVTHYDSVAMAMQAMNAGEGLVYFTIISSDDVNVSYFEGMKIKNAGGANITITGVTSEYVVNSSTEDGITTYTRSNAPTAYVWTNAYPDNSNWTVPPNWNVSGGTTAGRYPQAGDTVTFNDGATVTLNESATVAGITVNGDVSISGTAVSLNTSGNITGSGILTLSDVCLASAKAGITVAPAVNFTNDSELAGANALTFNGDVVISDMFRVWNSNHVIAGDVTINSGVTFKYGSLLTINGAATVKGAFTRDAGSSSCIKFSGAVTIENGNVSIDGWQSGNLGDAATVVLAGANASLTDTRGIPIADNKVSTTVADSYVKKTGSTFAVAAKTVVTVSVGANVSLTIDGNAVADGATLKFTPGDTFTYVATPAANYTAAVAVAGGTDNDGTVTVGETAITVAATATLNTYTITIPSVANTTVSVTYTSGGDAQEATADGDITVDAGTSLTATWTAASGYKITAGASQTINPVAAAQTLTEPTVEAKGATVSGVTFNYGNDFATATVTATVSGDATAYTFTVGGANYEGTVVGSTVTFSNVATGHATAYDSVSYSITASDGTSPVDVSGGSGSVKVADMRTWIHERAASSTGASGSAAGSGGSWTTAVTYNDNVAAVENNTFSANNCSTGDCVTVTVNDAVYTSLSDTSNMSVFDEDSQGAVALGETNVNEVTTMCFMILAKEAGNFVWKPATWDGNTPQLDTPYDIAVTFDYAAKKYSVCIDGTNLTVGVATNFNLCAEKSELKSITFNGEGTLRSIEGIESTGYMVKAANGTYYPTIAAAITAYNADSTIGELYVLHDGTVPVGWMIVEVGGVKYLRKAPKGSLFIAF